MNIAYKQNDTGFQSVKFDAEQIPGIEAIEIELYNSLSGSQGTMREMCSHILNAGGKRIRPLLVLHSGLGFGTMSNHLVKAAVAAELIHMASLVHDDIIDNSSLRRSRPSINKIWGNQFAVLCGDYLFSKAFGIMSSNRLMRSMDLMVEAIQNMCEGEIVQAGERFNPLISQERYYEIIGMKTAIFLSCCCKSGAAISGATKLQVHMMGEYGLHLGYAFQIIDDILDFCGKVENMGKPRCEDLRQGNITLPAIMLLNNDHYKEKIVDVISKKGFTEQECDGIVSDLEASGTVDRCFALAVYHIEKAKESLELMPQSEHMTFLRNLADVLKARAN